MNSIAVRTEGLVRRFGRKSVLEGVDLEVPEGSVTALLGRNGAGKTTLFRILFGILPPQRGEARILGLDPASRGPTVRRLVGYVPERLELPPWMKVGDYLRFLEPFYPNWDRAEERRLLQILRLDPSARVRTLSKGERTKHALVAALAHRPTVVFLDEPFSGLDPIVRTEVLSAILGHLRDANRTVLLATHSLGEVERACDRVAILGDGRIRLAGELEDILNRTVRFAVTLEPGAEPWEPPGDPVVDRRGGEAVLFYLRDEEVSEALLRSDRRIRDVERLPRDLNDVFCAVAGKGE